VGKTDGKTWDHRGHSFAAAEAMRRVLVESTRRKGQVMHRVQQQCADFGAHSIDGQGTLALVHNGLKWPTPADGPRMRREGASRGEFNY
jgi:hypothetical protein